MAVVQTSKFQCPKSHNSGMVADKLNGSCEYSNIGSLAKKLKHGANY